MRWAGPAFRLIALVVLLTAMASRALIPQGWMPSPAGDAAPLIVCTGHGLGQPHEPGDQKRQAQHDVCAFAGHAATTPPAAPALAFFVPIELGAAPPADLPPGVIAQPGPARAQSPRAPPLRA